MGALFEDFAEHTGGLHYGIQSESAQEAVKSGCAPWPIPGGVEYHPKGDVPSNSKADRKYDPLTYQHSTGPVPRRSGPTWG